jgi:hypothetical protein
MKINTKNCSPMAGAPQEAIIRPNKYIRSSTTSEEGDLHAGFFHPTTPNGKKSATAAPSAPTKKKQPTADATSGRHVMFLPTIVYTPVQTSARHHKDDSSSSSTASSSNKSTANNITTTSSQTTAARRLLSADDVDALNQRLEQLIIGHKEGEEEENDDEEEAKHDNSSKSFGRIETTAFSYKTSSNSQVLRSARFQK